jgi:hypothetical protein
MLNFCGIVAAILKMEIGRNFSMSGINSGRWNRTMLNLCGIVAAILKMATVEIFRCQESIRDIIIYPHMKWRWNRKMLNLCGIVAAILKMATGRNFSMSGINSGHHYLSTYKILMISDNVEFYRPFLCRVLAAILKTADISKILKTADISKILKTQNCSSNGDLSLSNFMFLSLSI